MTDTRIDEEYRWRLYDTNEDGTQWWKVHNTRTGRTVSCTTESAALKIIALAKSMRDNTEKPLNHAILERKARVLQWKELDHEKQIKEAKARVGVLRERLKRLQKELALEEESLYRLERSKHE